MRHGAWVNIFCFVTQVRRICLSLMSSDKIYQPFIHSMAGIQTKVYSDNDLDLRRLTKGEGYQVFHVDRIGVVKLYLKQCSVMRSKAEYLTLNIGPKTISF